MTQLGQHHLDWLCHRGIDADVAVRFGVYSGRRHRIGNGKNQHTEVKPDATGEVLVFPTLMGGDVVGEHYRLPHSDKHGLRFFQRKGSAQVFWNYNCLDGDALERGEQLIITEGQMDALACLCCGLPFVVSMPSGSQKPEEGSLPTDVSSRSDEPDKPGGRFGSLYHSKATLAKAKRIILATDRDASGIRLASELERRLGSGRCYRIEYPTDCLSHFDTHPKDCKDLNDVLLHHGPQALLLAVTNAKPCPTKGIYTLNQIVDRGDPYLWKTGCWPGFDQCAVLAESCFVPVTGIPSHGKSLFAVNWLVNVALHNPSVHIGMTSFETAIKPTVSMRMRRMALHDDSWINDRFVWIEHDPGETDEDMTVEWLLDRFYDCYMRFGTTIFLVDPWNELEHQRSLAESQSEYQNRALRRFKAFSKRYGICLVVLAHPTKDVHEKGKIRCPNLYDIDGSAAWRNKADLGLTIHRPDFASHRALVKVDKAKYEFLGKVSESIFQYSSSLGRFDEVPTQTEINYQDKDSDL